MATIGSLNLNLTAQSASLIRELNKSSQAVNNAARQMNAQTKAIGRGFDAANRAAGAFKSGLAGIVAGIGIGGLVQVTKRALDSADALNDAASKIGVTVEQLQELRFAADRAGVASQTLDTALQRFSRRIGEAASGGGVLRDVLIRNNIALRDASGNLRPVVDILGDYAELVQSTQSPQEQLTLAFKAFDSEGAALVNTLREGSEGIERYREQARQLGIITQEQAEAAARANDALADLSQTVGTSLTGAIAAAAPQIEGLAFVLQEAFGATRDFFEKLNAVDSQKLNLQIADLNQELAELIAKRRELAQVAEAQGIAPAETFAVQEANRQIQATLRQRDALLKQRDALQAVEGEQRDLNASGKPLEITIRKYAESSDQAAVATTALSDAQAEAARNADFMRQKQVALGEELGRIAEETRQRAEDAERRNVEFRARRQLELTDELGRISQETRERAVAANRDAAIESGELWR